VQEQVLDQVKDEELRVYAVWVPIRWSDGKASIPQATKRFTDPRVSHYWNKGGELVNAYSRILRIDGPAWDVYLLFDRSAEWKEQPPAPTVWMDQLGLDREHDLDGAKLSTEARKLLQITK